MSAKSKTISQREFARRDGCTPKTVRNAIRDGHLVKLPGGGLAAALVGTGWRKTNRRGADLPGDPGDLPGDTEDLHGDLPGDLKDLPGVGEVDEDLFKGAETFIRRVLRGDYETLAEAERIKENGLALKHMLDNQRKAGNLIPLRADEAAFFEAARDNRDAWMGWVSRIGVIAAAELKVNTRLFTDVMGRLVHQHLTELGEPEFEPGLDPAES